MSWRDKVREIAEELENLSDQLQRACDEARAEDHEAGDDLFLLSVEVSNVGSQLGDVDLS